MPTLKELNAQPGDVVMYDNRSKFTVKEGKTLYSHFFKNTGRYNSRWDTVSKFTMVSRANQPNEIQVGKTYKVVGGGDYEAIYEDGDRVWMKLVDSPSSPACVWTKGGKALSLTEEWDVDWGPVVVEGVDVYGGHHLWVFNDGEPDNCNLHIDFTVTTIDGKPEWTTLKVKDNS